MNPTPTQPNASVTTEQFEVVREHVGKREIVLKTGNLAYATAYADRLAKKNPNMGVRVWSIAENRWLHTSD